MSAEMFALPSDSDEVVVGERRATLRYNAGRTREVRILVRPGLQSYRAVIRDFSRIGIGMIAQRSLPVGTILAIELRSAKTGLSCVLAGTIEHATPQGDGTWILGCRLSRLLSDEEVLALL